jgi:hypothetical protein
LGVAVFLLLHLLIFAGVLGTRYDAWIHVSDLSITILGFFAVIASVTLGTIFAIVGLASAPKKTLPLVGLLLNVLPVIAIFLLLQALGSAFVTKF